MAHEDTQPLEYIADYGCAIPEKIKQNPGRLWREKPIGKTSEFQGNYTEFKQNIAEKRVLVIWKISESQMMFGKWRLRGARLQTLTTRLLSKEYESGSQKCSQKLVFVPYVFSENSTKIFFGQPKGYEKSEQNIRALRNHILSAFFQAMRIATVFRKGQIHLRKLLCI